MRYFFVKSRDDLVARKWIEKMKTRVDTRNSLLMDVLPHVNLQDHRPPKWMIGCYIFMVAVCAIVCILLIIEWLELAFLWRVGYVVIPRDRRSVIGIVRFIDDAIAIRVTCLHVKTIYGYLCN